MIILEDLSNIPNKEVYNRIETYLKQLGLHKIQVIYDNMYSDGMITPPDTQDIWLTDYSDIKDYTIALIMYSVDYQLNLYEDTEDTIHILENHLKG